MKTTKKTLFKLIFNLVRLIMDFIPNHTGKMSEWFLKSQRKEGKYSDYYIWAPCDPNTYSYPNNWVLISLSSFTPASDDRFTNITMYPLTVHI